MPAIRQITVPIPFPLEHAHAYLLETSDGWVMVDSGFASDEAAAILVPAVREVVTPASPLRAVVISHFHPDHTGLAGLLERDFGAEVIIHRADWDHLARMRDTADGGPPSEMRQGIMQHLGGDATPPWERPETLARSHYPLPERPTLVDGGERLRLGDRTIELVWTPGHTEGHLCFYDEGEELLFTGDHILSRITPHIGMYFGEDANPLHDFEASLDIVIDRGPMRALGAHEDPIDDVAARAAEIKDHHERRRQDILDALSGEPLSPLDIARAAFPRRKDNRMQLFMALAETLAHLQAMEHEGTVVRIGEGSETRFRLAG